MVALGKLIQASRSFVVRTMLRTATDHRLKHRPFCLTKSFRSGVERVFTGLMRYVVIEKMLLSVTRMLTSISVPRMVAIMEST
jgi:hypothetical protein